PSSSTSAPAWSQPGVSDSVTHVSRGRGVATVVRSVAYSAVIRTTDGTGSPSGVFSALDGAGGHPGDDLAVEEQEHHQRRDGDEQDVGEQQVVLGLVLALEVVERELHGGVELRSEGRRVGKEGR